MSIKLRAVFKRYAVQILFLAALIFCFNNWLLGPLLNPTLVAANGSVSELSVISEPHATIFRSLDIAAGVLFLLFGCLLYWDTPRSKGGKTMAVLLALLGAGEIIDASLPLRCAESLGNSCVIPVSLSLRHLTLPSHAYSSVLIAAAYFLLPLTGIILSRKASIGRSFLILSWVALLVAVFSFLQVMVDSLGNHSFESKGTGSLQSLHMLLLSVWFVAGFIFWKSQTAVLEQAK
jgi:hypothetical protein